MTLLDYGEVLFQIRIESLAIPHYEDVEGHEFFKEIFFLHSCAYHKSNEFSFLNVDEILKMLILEIHIRPLFPFQPPMVLPAHPCSTLFTSEGL